MIPWVYILQISLPPFFQAGEGFQDITYAWRAKKEGEGKEKRVEGKKRGRGEEKGEEGKKKEGEEKKKGERGRKKRERGR